MRHGCTAIPPVLPLECCLQSSSAACRPLAPAAVLAGNTLPLKRPAATTAAAQARGTTAPLQPLHLSCIPQARTSGVELGLLLGRLVSRGCLGGVLGELAAVLLLDGPQAAAGGGSSGRGGARRRRRRRERRRRRGCLGRAAGVPRASGAPIHRCRAGPAAGGGRKAPRQRPGGPTADGCQPPLAGCSGRRELPAAPMGPADPGAGPGATHVPARLHGGLHGARGGLPAAQRPSRPSIHSPGAPRTGGGSS